MSTRLSLFPAIDLIDGAPVRLIQGDYAQKTQYNIGLGEICTTFNTFSDGIHVVDLDGAKAGKVINIEAIQTIRKNTSGLIEVGGGVRSIEDVQMLFDSGVDRIILGTSALNDLPFVEQVFSLFGREKIVIGLDAKDGYIATHGWEETSSLKVSDCITNLLEKVDLKTIIFTDIATDGMLQGPSYDATAQLCQDFPDLDIVASGGVSCLSDIKKLSTLPLAGCIFGKAFYEGHISAKELQDWKSL